MLVFENRKGMFLEDKAKLTGLLVTEESTQQQVLEEKCNCQITDVCFECELASEKTQIFPALVFSFC